MGYRLQIGIPWLKGKREGTQGTSRRPSHTKLGTIRANHTELVVEQADMCND